MKNSIRCWISCFLPCGALDVIRIVHSDGRVEEFHRRMTAGDVMNANPDHVVRNPSSSPSEHDGDVPKIVILSPDAELRRGKIYFLVHVSQLPEKARPRAFRRRRRREHGSNVSSISVRRVSDQYLSEILSENITTQRDRRKGRVGVWRPHLESIEESDQSPYHQHQQQQQQQQHHQHHRHHHRRNSNPFDEDRYSQ